MTASPWLKSDSIKCIVLEASTKIAVCYLVKIVDTIHDLQVDI